MINGLEAKGVADTRRTERTELNQTYSVNDVAQFVKDITADNGKLDLAVKREMGAGKKELDISLLFDPQKFPNVNSMAIEDAIEKELTRLNFKVEFVHFGYIPGQVEIPDSLNLKIRWPLESK
jgi:hypothetical protein